MRMTCTVPGTSTCNFVLSSSLSKNRKRKATMMIRLPLSMAMLVVLPTSQLVGALSQQNSPSSRRSFMAQGPALVGSAATMGWFVNFDAHEAACQCSQCAHGANCPCNSCAPSFRPKSAAAYERDVGGASPSAVTAAFNIQARETNARLERDGFKLDTKEEEAARLSGALASFSYDSSTNTGKQTGRKYGAKKQPSEKK